MDIDITDKSVPLPPSLAFAINAEAALERLHEVAKRMRENIERLLSEEEKHQSKAEPD
jgi:hypothetical protein